MSGDFTDAFQACLQALEDGSDLERVLARFPQFERELKSLLEIAKLLRETASERVPRGAHLRSRTAMLRKVNSARSPRQHHGVLRWFSGAVGVAVAALSLILVSGFGLAMASAQALPGDDLYPIKRAAESIQLSFTPSNAGRVSLSIFHSQRRLSEIRQMIAEGRSLEVVFEASLTAQEGNLWSFEDIPVIVTQSTDLEDGLHVGDLMVVSGRTTPGGWVLAHKIEAAEYRFEGVLQKIAPTTWTVAERSFLVVESTQVEQGLTEGDRVRVHVHREQGLDVALRIQLMSPSATPQPTLEAPQPWPTAQPTAKPTAVASEEPDEEEETAGLEEFDLLGVLQEKSAQRWKVDGTWIYLTDETDIEGQIVVGSVIRVKGRIGPAGDRIAEEIRLNEPPDTEEAEPTPDEDPDPTETEEADSTETEEPDSNETEEPEEIEFEGVVHSITGNTWLIGDKTVLVNEDTRFKGDPETGDTVEVRAEPAADGTLYAERIEVEKKGN